MSNQSNNEMQTNLFHEALNAYLDGYEIYIANPLDVNDEDKMNSAEQIISHDGHLFIIKEKVVK